VADHATRRGVSSQRPLPVRANSGSISLGVTRTVTFPSEDKRASALLGGSISYAAVVLPSCSWQAGTPRATPWETTRTRGCSGRGRPSEGDQLLALALWLISARTNIPNRAVLRPPSEHWYVGGDAKRAEADRAEVARPEARTVSDCRAVPRARERAWPANEALDWRARATGEYVSAKFLQRMAPVRTPSSSCAPGWAKDSPRTRSKLFSWNDFQRSRQY